MWSARAEFQDSKNSHDEASSNRSVLSGWFWLTLLLLSGGLFLASNSVMAGAIIPAVVAMQPALQASRWIRKSDPNFSRANACSLFLVATGCWNALLAGLVALAVLIGVAILCGQPPDESQGMACIYGIAVAALGTCLIGCSAAWTAWTHRVRVWVHPKLRRMAEYEFSNLQHLIVKPETSNYAFFVMAISLVLPVVGLSTGWLIYLAGVPVPDEDKAIANTCGLASLTIGPIITVGVLMFLSRRLLAGSPIECWSDSAVEVENA